MFEEQEQTGLCRIRPNRIVGWNTRLNQFDPVNTWFRHRRLTGIRHNEKVDGLSKRYFVINQQIAFHFVSFKAL